MTLTPVPEWIRGAGNRVEPTAEPVSLVGRQERPRSTSSEWGRPAYALYSAERSATRQVTAAPRILEARQAAFLALAQQLSDLLTGETNFDEEYLPPTERAINAFLDLLGNAAIELYTPLPEGLLYPDGDGGLRVDWRQDNRQVRLVIHHASTSQDYVYHQERADYDLETSVTARRLAGWLRWLTGRTK